MRPRTAIGLAAIFALTGCGSAKIAEAKRLVAAELRDPDSVKFGEVYERDVVICGTVNGKNAYGAYAGPRRFVVVDTLVTLEPEALEETGRDTFAMQWELCSGERQPTAAEIERAADNLSAEPRS